MLSHSWGDNVFRNFMRWAENQENGWCDKHIEAYVNIAGPVLGVPKAVSACLSGQPLPPVAPLAAKFRRHSSYVLVSCTSNCCYLPGDTYLPDDTCQRINSNYPIVWVKGCCNMPNEDMPDMQTCMLHGGLCLQAGLHMLHFHEAHCRLESLSHHYSA